MRYFEVRLRAKMNSMPAEKRARCEVFIKEQNVFYDAREQADAAWSEFERTPSWRVFKRRALERKAMSTSVNFFVAVGDEKAAAMMRARI